MVAGDRVVMDILRVQFNFALGLQHPFGQHSLSLSIIVDEFNSS